MNKFKKGDYVILLSSCDGGDCWSSIPVNYVYKLSSDSDTLCFMIERNKRGVSDGWSTSPATTLKKLKLRAATWMEIQDYETWNKPCPARVIENEINNIYEIY